MTAFNAVRFKIKPCQEQTFLDAHRKEVMFSGMHEAHLIKTGERSYCLIAKWDLMEKLVPARCQMIATHDSFDIWATESV